MASVGSIPLGNSGASIEQASQLSQLKAGIQDFFQGWKDDSLDHKHSDTCLCYSQAEVPLLPE